MDWGKGRGTRAELCSFTGETPARTELLHLLGKHFPGAELKVVKLTVTLWYSLASDCQDTSQSELNAYRKLCSSLGYGHWCLLVRKLLRVLWWHCNLILTDLIISALGVFNSLCFKIILMGLKDVVPHWHRDVVTRCSVSKAPQGKWGTSVGLGGRSFIPTIP